MSSNFSCMVELRFNDIDIYGHLNNAVYLSLMEQARVKFFNHFFPHHNWNETGIIVANINIDYLKPIPFIPEIQIDLHISKTGIKSFVVEYCFLHQHVEMAKATSTLVCYDYKNRQTISIPDKWLNIFTNKKAS